MARDHFLIFQSDDALLPEEQDLEYMNVPENQLTDSHLTAESVRSEFSALALEVLEHDDNDPSVISQDMERHTHKFTVH